jgi:large conductance mechanosensitive channel
MIGKFLGDVLNLLIVALAVFIAIVKIVGAVMRKATPPPPAGAPTNKECPMCLSVIPIKARKCGHCTSDLEPVGTGA